MRIINRGRGTGKTSILISTAYATDTPIIVMTEQEKESIENRAKEMGCDIIVMTAIEFFHGAGRCLHPEEILVDEIDQFLSYALNNYFGCTVTAGTMTVPMVDINKEDKNE